MVKTIYRKYKKENDYELEEEDMLVLEDIFQYHPIDFPLYYKEQICKHLLEYYKAKKFKERVEKEPERWRGSKEIVKEKEQSIKEQKGHIYRLISHSRNRHYDINKQRQAQFFNWFFLPVLSRYIVNKIELTVKCKNKEFGLYVPIEKCKDCEHLISIETSKVTCKDTKRLEELRRASLRSRDTIEQRKRQKKYSMEK
jgi:hypothetical protein